MSERIGCGYCYRTVGENSPDTYSSRTIICTNCDTFYHKSCKETFTACLVCEGTAFKEIDIDTPQALRAIQRRHIPDPSLAQDDQKLEQRIKVGVGATAGVIVLVIVGVMMSLISPPTTAEIDARLNQYIVAEDIDGGIDYFTRIINRDSDNAAAYGARSRLYLVLNDFEAAEQDVLTATRLDSINTVVLNAGAWYARETNDLEEALTLSTRSVIENVECYDCLVTSCLMQELDGQHTRASERCERAIDLSPSNPRAYQYYAYTLYSLGRTSEARTQAQEAIDLAPDYAGGYFALGYIEGVEGNNNLSIDYFEQVLQRRPSNAVAYYNIAIAYEELGDYDEAIDYVSTSVELNPNRAASWQNLGFYHEQLGETSLAVQYYCDYIERADSPRSSIVSYVNANGGCN